MLETRRAKECQRGTAGAEERAKEGGRVLAEGSDTRLGARCREFESPHSDHEKSLEPQWLQAFFTPFFLVFSLWFSLYRLETPLMYCSIRSALACFISSVTWPYTSNVKEAL